MTHHLKILMLTLVAALALGAATAATASGTEFHSETESTFLAGEQKEIKQLDTTNPMKASFKCSKTTLAGEMVGKQPKN